MFAAAALLPMPDQLQRLRAAIYDQPHPAAMLEGIVAGATQVEVTTWRAETTTNRAAPATLSTHPRIELLQAQGIVMSKAWPVGVGLGTSRPGPRRGTLDSARPAQRVDRPGTSPWPLT